MSHEPEVVVVEMSEQATVATSLWEAPYSPERDTGTVGDAARSAATAWPNRTALIDGDDPRQRWTFAELADWAERLAHGLLTRFAPGEHLAVWAPNQPLWVALEIASGLAGLTMVTVNPALGADEVAFVLRQSRSAGVLLERSHRGVDLAAQVARVRSGLPDLREVICFDEADQLVSEARGTLPVVRADDPAQIQYTSGTTGFPKGALLSHRGLVDNGWLFATTLGAGADDVWLNPMPLFHTAGCGLITLGALQTGGAQVLLRSFDADRLLDLAETERATITTTVPTMLVRVLAAQRQKPRRLDTFRLWTLGGAPVAPELLARATEELGMATGIGYGQTEASPYLTHTLPDDPHPSWQQTVGRPMPEVSVRISPPGEMRPVPLGEVGEICTRSRCVMIGYHDEPVATAVAIDAQGWLRTGDLGAMDEHGYVTMKGRIKDLIIRGGENVYPREVEDVLHQHDAVADVAVVGAPDAEWGEQVAAFVRLDRPVDVSDLEAFCRAHLAGYKVPRTWRFVDTFPQTASGKIRKLELQQALISEPDTTRADV